MDNIEKAISSAAINCPSCNTEQWVPATPLTEKSKLITRCGNKECDKVYKIVHRPYKGYSIKRPGIIEMTLLVFGIRRKIKKNQTAS